MEKDLRLTSHDRTGSRRASPFDAAAPDYDATFTASVLGGLMRRAVWRRLDLRFAPGDRVLELGCGTGEDAVHLARRGILVLATDASAAMTGAARRKVTAAGLADRVSVQELAIEDLAGAGGKLGGPFDGALSSFGALNCVADLAAAARALADRLRPGATAALCVMGPLVPWEWAWFLARGRPRTAFRRLASGGARWRGMTVQYPSIRRLRRAFAPAFRLLRIGAVGALLPPTYAEAWAARHPRLVARLDRWERRFEARWPLPWLADHYLAELERL